MFYGEQAPYGVMVKSEHDMVFSFSTKDERDSWVMRDELHRMPIETDEPYAKGIDWRGVIAWGEWCRFNGIEEEA